MKKTFKHIMALWLALSYVLTLSAALTKDKDGYYLIGSSADLVAYRDGVNKGTAMNGRLSADIDMSAVCGVKKSWQPINTKKLAIRFDGGNHVVKNLYIDAQSDEQALFYCADVVENLVVTDSYVRGLDYVAGLVVCGSGSSGKFLVNNCHFNGNVIGRQYVGGIIAGKDMVTANIANCSNNGLILGNNYVGGILGTAVGCNIANVYNAGRVKAYFINEGTSFLYEGIAGGIAGFFGGALLYNCYNYGKISGLSTGSLIGERGGQIASVFQYCYALENMAQVSSSESSISFLPLTSFKNGTLKTNLNTFVKATPSIKEDQFGITVEMLTWDQSSDMDHPCFSNLIFSPNKNFAVQYRGDYWGIDVFSSNMSLPQSDNKAFSYQFSEKFNGKNVVGDTVVVVTKVLNDNFLSKDKDGFYLVQSASDLSLFRDAVNGGANNINGRLARNIDMREEKNWEPIGSRELCCSTPFSGVFDGAGYTISGLTETEGYEYAALFSHLKNSMIENLNIAQSSFTGYYVGSICAYAEKSIIVNCGSNAEVIGLYPEGAAGFIGVAVDCQIVNCYNIGSVTGEGKVSGFLGVQQKECVIDNCFSSCTVTNTGTENGGKSPFVFEYLNRSITNCFYDSTLYVSNSNEAVNHLNPLVVGMTTSDMKSKSFVKILNDGVYRINHEQSDFEAFAWVIDSTTGYPKIDLNEVVGLDDVLSDKGMNPTSVLVYAVDDMLFIQSEFDGIALVYNTLGQVRRVVRYARGLTEIEGLESGIYFVEGEKIIIR